MFFDHRACLNDVDGPRGIKLKEEKEGRFEARVRCLELEEKLKKLSSA